MDYTIDDLRGRWVNKGTHECKIFLDQLYELGLIPSRFDVSYFGGDVIAVCDGDFVVGLWREENTCLTNDRMFIPKPQWSIYTNDKPLCELTDEQAAALFNWWRSGGETEFKLAGDNPWNSNYPMSFPTWNSNVAYRAKQKSECELFVDVAVSVYDGRTGLSESAMSLAAQMMFKSGKFKLVEDNNK